MSLNPNDFFKGAWFKHHGQPFETWGYDNTLCIVTGRFEDHSFRELPIEQIQPIQIFDSILPAFGLAKTKYGYFEFRHFHFIRALDGTYACAFGALKFIHELQRVMICLKESAVVYDSDIIELIRLYPDF